MDCLTTRPIDEPGLVLSTVVLGILTLETRKTSNSPLQKDIATMSDELPHGSGPQGGSGFGHIVSLTTAAIGISLIWGSLSIQHEENGLFILDNWIQIIMLVAGSVSIIVSVVTYYLRKNPDKFGW